MFVPIAHNSPNFSLIHFLCCYCLSCFFSHRSPFLSLSMIHVRMFVCVCVLCCNRWKGEKHSELYVNLNYCSKWVFGTTPMWCVAYTQTISVYLSSFSFWFLPYWRTWEKAAAARSHRSICSSRTFCACSFCQYSSFIIIVRPMSMCWMPLRRFTIYWRSGFYLYITMNRNDGASTIDTADVNSATAAAALAATYYHFSDAAFNLKIAIMFTSTKSFHHNDYARAFLPHENLNFHDYTMSVFTIRR